MMLRPNDPETAIPPAAPGTLPEKMASCSWPAWLRRVDRKRRRAQSGRAVLSPAYFSAATYASFSLAEMNISPGQVAEALATSASRRTFRSRQNQRIRNHIAILHRIERLLDQSLPLTPAIVVRWYTSISSGLCTAALDGSSICRLQDVLRELNTPHPRLRRALPKAASLHASLLAAPLFPAFNSILARLFLRYQLGRHGLPPILFEPVDRENIADSRKLLPLLLERLGSSLDQLAAG